MFVFVFVFVLVLVLVLVQGPELRGAPVGQVEEKREDQQWREHHHRLIPASLMAKQQGGVGAHRTRVAQLEPSSCMSRRPRCATMAPVPRLTDPVALLDAAGAGDRGALAQLLTMVEAGGEPARAVGRLAHPLGGAAYTVGITGAPGSGKSTLTSALLTELRADDLLVGVLAIDPSSPFSGGAILGDRVRMSDHALDAGVFIRSMATRGHLGGLSLAAPEAVRLLDAVGRDLVVVETVGVGQVEVEIVGEADTTVVVLNPGWGDAVQANKAGLMEIADVFVINKADRPGVADTRRDLEQMLMLVESGPWQPTIVQTVASSGEGVSELWAAIGEHRSHVEQSGELARRREQRLRDELRRIVAALLAEQARLVTDGERFVQAAQQVVDRELDPWTAAAQLLDVP